MNYLADLSIAQYVVIGILAVFAVAFVFIAWMTRERPMRVVDVSYEFAETEQEAIDKVHLNVGEEDGCYMFCHPTRQMGDGLWEVTTRMPQ